MKKLSQRQFAEKYNACKASWALRPCPKLTFQINSEERIDTMKEKTEMQAFQERGYYVKENMPVYYTVNVERTLLWFRAILGWYGHISARDKDGIAECGCVFDYPSEIMKVQLGPFRGIHLFRGKPSSGVVGFIMVQGLEKLRQHVVNNGWEHVSEIEAQPWGANECRVKTENGCVLRFFEMTK
ncbi:MAG: hypothetical protein FWF69_04785 [Firmicutes bacterium]|nr:hypothetical protein [Bacillota bacterium]